MDEWMIIAVPDVEDDELFIYDTFKTKEEGKLAFEHLVVDGFSEDMFALVKVVFSAENVKGGSMTVVENGEGD